LSGWHRPRPQPAWHPDASGQTGLTTIQRGDARVHIEDLGVGNYIMVQAAPVPSATGNPLGFGFEPQKPRDGGDKVGTNMGERTPTFEETNEN
jgi:hypothetical protein